MLERMASNAGSPAPGCRRSCGGHERHDGRAPAGHGLAVHGAPEGFDALLLARRPGGTTRRWLHVCRDDARMARMAEALGFFAPAWR
jgi:hypothetical protein